MTLSLHKLMLLPILLVLFGLRQAASQTQEALEYQFDLRLPALEQPNDFKNPHGIAASPDGTLWIIGDDIVQHFKTDGSFIGQFYASGRKYSTDDYLSALTVAPDGSVWVINSRMNRIQHFTADGKLINEINLYNSDYYAQHSVLNLTSMALASDGSLWVVDSYYFQLIHFNIDGSLLGTFAFTSANPSFSLGTENIVATAPDNSLWLVSRDGLHIEHYLADGTLLGQLNDTAITGLTIAADGSLWALADSKVKHLGAEGNLIAQFGSGLGDQAGQLKTPKGIALSKDGSVWIADTGNNRLQQFKPDGSFSIQTANGIHLSSPRIGQAGSLWVVDGQHRIQHFDSKGSFIGYFGYSGDCLDDKPYTRKIALAPDNSLWLIDNYEFHDYHSDIPVFTGHGAVCIQHFTEDGHLIKRFQTTSSNPYDPIAGAQHHQLSIAADGSVWLLNRDSNLIQHFTADGILIKAFQNDKQVVVKSIAMAGDGSIWALSNASGTTGPNSYTKLIQHYHADGTLIGQFDFWAANPSKFYSPPSSSNPQDIAIATDGSIWVMNSAFMVEHFTADGHYIEQFEITDSIGTNNFGIVRAYDNLTEFAVGSDNSVWVSVNAGNDRLLKFTPKKPSPIPAEFDRKTGVLILRDVVKDGKNYYAILKTDLMNNEPSLFTLITYKSALNTYTEASQYDADAKRLNIPSVNVDGKFYEVVLKDNGPDYYQDGSNYYQLISASPK